MLFCAALLVAGVGTRANAQEPPAPSTLGPGPDDYAPENEQWNGLATFLALARGASVTPDVRRDIAWDEAKDAPLLLIHPTEELPVEALLRFVASGGRVVLADDFGVSEPLVARLGLGRRHGRPNAPRFYDENPALPAARPRSEHPLTRDLAEVVTNHPAWFRGDAPALLAFGAEEIVCTALPVGKGELVLLSDPSVLINTMLEFEGNLAFARNLLLYITKPGGRLIVATKGFRFRGDPLANAQSVTDSPEAAQGGHTPLLPLYAFLTAFNQFLGELAAAKPERALLLALLVGGALAAIFAALLLTPPPRGGTPSWAIGPEPHPIPFEIVVQRCASGSKEGYGLLAMLIREELERRLEKELGLHYPAFGHSEEPLARIEHLHGKEARRLLASLLRRLRTVPSPSVGQAAPPLARRRLERLHRDVERFCSLLETDKPNNGKTP